MEREKAVWGLYTSVFWRFYESDNKTMRNEYNAVNEAHLAQVSILRTMSRKHIFDVRITRRRNVLYLEKIEK